MSMVQCNVLGCTNSRYENSKIRFHWYPLSMDLRREWILRTNPSLLSKTVRYVLCDQHFEDHQFQTPERLKLNRNAVPDRNLPTILTEDEVVITEEIVGESPIETLKNYEFIHDYTKLIVVKDISDSQEILPPLHIKNHYGKHKNNVPITPEPRVGNDNHVSQQDRATYQENMEKGDEFLVTSPKKSYKRQKSESISVEIVQLNIENEIVNYENDAIELSSENTLEDVTMCHPLDTDRDDTNESEDILFSMISLFKNEPVDLINAEKNIIEHDSKQNSTYVCRLCLSTNRKLKNINDSVGDLSFYDKFSACFPDLQLSHTNKYDSVCDVCYQKLDRVYRFRLMVTSIEDELKKFKILRTPVEKFCENYSKIRRQLEVRQSAKNDARKLRKLLEKQKVDQKIFVANDYLSIDNSSAVEMNRNFYLPFVAVNEKENSENGSNLTGTNQVFEEPKVILSKETFPKRKLIQKGPNNIYDVVYIDEKGNDIGIPHNIVPKIENEISKIAYSLTESKVLDEKGNIIKDKIVVELIKSEDLSNEIQESSEKLTVQELPLPTKRIEKASQKLIKKFFCEKCGSRFVSEETLLRHTKDHSIDHYIRDYECPICPQKFSTLKLLTYHKRKHFTLHKSIKKFLCGVCNMSFSTYSRLKSHRYGHTKPFLCGHCPRRFTSMKNKQNHESWHNGESYVCEICSKSFSCSDGLKNHLLRHEVLRKVNFVCEICGKGFMTSSDFNSHSTIHTGVKNFMCNLCLVTFRTKNNLKIHMYHHTKDRPHKCELCGKSYRTKSLLLNHYNSHNGYKKFQCQICDKKISDKKSFTIHLRSHTGELPFKCDKCEQEFTSRSGLKRHFIRKHTNIRNYKCDICNFAFTFKAELTRHKSRHEGIRKFCCEKCGKAFIDNNTLRNHIKSVHENLRPYSCTNCDKKFKQLAHLKTHQLVHSEKKSFKCEECDKSFSTKYHFEQHELIHAASKPFACKLCRKGFEDEKSSVEHECRVWSCPKCDKCFYNRNTFYCHKKTHDDKPKKVKCDICAKEIKDVYCLKLHMRTHTKEKPFKCEICLKSFTQSGSLKTHLNLHLKVKNFQCDFCPKSFRQAAHLRTHKNYHFGIRPFNCNQCYKSYFQKRDLIQHMEKIHSVFAEESNSEESNQDILLQIDEFGDPQQQFQLNCAE